jgi:hypothetical protein
MPGTDISTKMLSADAYVTRLKKLSEDMQTHSNMAASISGKRDALNKLLVGDEHAKDVTINFDNNRTRFIIEMGPEDNKYIMLMAHILLDMINERLENRLAMVRETARQIASATNT